jgi:hypothetical protein
MINIQHFREYVIRPTLNHLGLYSENAEELLLATAIQESRLTYLKQLGNGPAVSVYQVEPATHADIWDNYLRYHPELNAKLQALKSDAYRLKGVQEMTHNLAYATAIARIHYLRVPHPLPDKNSVEEMARYWKIYYNTVKGRGTEQEFIDAYQKHVARDR